VSRTLVATAGLCALHGTLQWTRCDRVGECELTVDQYHREIDAIAPLELVVAVDRDAPEAVAEPRRLVFQQLHGTRAEPAPRPLVEHDLDGASPRR